MNSKRILYPLTAESIPTETPRKSIVKNKKTATETAKQAILSILRVQLSWDNGYVEKKLYTGFKNVE